MKSNKVKVIKDIFLKSILFILLLTTSGCNYFGLFNKIHKEIKTSDGIIISNTIRDVAKYADQNDLIVFDIDLTLLKENLKIDTNDNPINSSLYRLMSDYITDHYYNENIYQIIKSIKAKKPEYDNNEFIIKEFKEYLRPIVNEKMVLLWNLVEQNISYIPMEKNIPNFINSLHEKNIKTMAFTAREWKVRKFTSNNLSNAGINLDKISIYDKTIEEAPVKNQYGYGYENNILYLIRGKDFTKATQKGSVIIKFFKKINYKPEKVIFIDNRLDNVQDVVSSLNQFGIKIIGIWYKFGGYEDFPKLKQQDFDFIEKYAGKNWWQIKINAKKAKYQILEKINKTSS